MFVINSERDIKMGYRKYACALAIILAGSAITSAIPPPLFTMPFEQINIEIQPAGSTLKAEFSVEYTFTNIVSFLEKIGFPLPPDANNIAGWMNDSPLSHQWSSIVYNSILPEVGQIPVMEWLGPFPQEGGTLKVQYEQALIKRQGEFIYFTPFVLDRGTATTVTMDIELPENFVVGGVWLKDIPQAYSVNDSHLSISFQTHTAPIYGPAEIIVSLVPSTLYVATDGDDGTGDGSKSKPFRTIQKGIDTAANGCRVFVRPGVYTEGLTFFGKAITVQGIATSVGLPMLEKPNDFAVSFYNGEGPDTILKNFVIKNSFLAVFIAGSSPTLRNLTIVNNKSGIEAYSGSEPNISSCIFWENRESDLFQCQASYSCTQQPGEGNINTDPLFADPCNGDYHLLSERGRYWPEHNVWVLDKVTSPCIDGGDPNADSSSEPRPNGGRINMGAFGGTPYASMSISWLDGDINYDHIVNMTDLAILADNWLKSEELPPPNKPPQVNIINLQDGTVFDYAIETIVIEANAIDVDGSVTLVEFFANENKIGEDDTGIDGWRINWQDFTPGSFILIAKATDNVGATATSPAVQIRILAGPLAAHDPTPPDGAINMPKSVIQWKAGLTALAHDVYFGTSETAVTNATYDSPEFTEQTNLLYCALVTTLQQPQTTYYWRIDELENETTIIKGDVWQFTTASFKAHSPVPADGSLSVDPNTILTWGPGFNIKSTSGHRIYFGTDAANLIYKGAKSSPGYNPGVLAKGTTYYWRIDEVNKDNMVAMGDVWRFTTAPS